MRLEYEFLMQIFNHTIFLMNFFQIKLLIENKLIICTLGNLHY